MRDALGHLPPGGLALSGEELGEVVEDEHDAEVLSLVPLEGGEAREEGQALAVPGHLELAVEAPTPDPVHPPDEGDQVGEVVGAEGEPVVAAHDGLGAEAEHAGGGAVDRGDDAVGVGGDDPRGHRLQDRLRVATALRELGVLGLEVGVRALELGLRGGEVLRHLVEGRHEDAHLVVGLRGRHAIPEVPGRDLARAFGEPLDGHGDALGQIQPEPGHREGDDEGHEEEEQDVDALDGTLQELELLVFLEGLRDPADLRLQLLGHVDGDDGRAHDPRVVGGGHDRHHPLDEVAAGDLPPGRQLPPSEGHPELLGVDGVRDRGHDGRT